MKNKIIVNSITCGIICVVYLSVVFNMIPTHTLINDLLYFDHLQRDMEHLSFFLFGVTFLLALLMGILILTSYEQRIKRVGFLFFALFIVGYAFWETNYNYHYFYLGSFINFMLILKVLVSVCEILFFLCYFFQNIKGNKVFKTLLYIDILWILSYLVYSLWSHGVNLDIKEWVYAIYLIPLVIIINSISGYRSIKFGWNIFLICHWIEILLLAKYSVQIIPLVRMLSIASFVILLFVMTGVIYIEIKNLHRRIIISSLESHTVFEKSQIINSLHDIKNRIAFLQGNYLHLDENSQKNALESEVMVLKETIMELQHRNRRVISKEFVEEQLNKRQEQYGKFVDFTYTIAEGDRWIVTELDFEIVMSHLLSNAYNAVMCLKGKIIRVEITPNKIVVYDNGKGFKKSISSIYSTKIGVESVKNVTFLYEGRVEFKCKKNYGTTVCAHFKKVIAR